jgi:hypothetical protein
VEGILSRGILVFLFSLPTPGVCAMPGRCQPPVHLSTSAAPVPNGFSSASSRYHHIEVNSNSDQELLRDYAERAAEEAFAQLVRRHTSPCGGVSIGWNFTSPPHSRSWL